MRRIIRYHRVSTKEQDDKGISLDAQARKTDGYCKLNFNEQDIVVGSFSEDYSGMTTDRPKFSIVRKMLKTGKANCIVCWKHDRLSRNAVDYAILRDELYNLGVELHYTDRGQIKLGDFSAEVMEDINGRAATKEINDIIERTTAAKKEKVMQGSVMLYARNIFGYHKIKEGKLWKLLINEDEARIVRQIFRWYVYGDEDSDFVSIDEMVRRLNALGKYGRWYRSRIHRILGTTAYIGYWTYLKGRPDAIVVKGIPRIINQQIWDKAQEKKEENRRKGGVKGKPKGNALLRSRAICGGCGKMLCVFPKKRTKDDEAYSLIYYQCIASRRPTEYAKGCSVKHLFKGYKIDEEVWQWVKNLLTNPDYLTQAIEEYNAQFYNEYNELEGELTSVEDALTQRTKQLEKVIDTYINTTGMTQAFLEQKTKELEEIIEGLQIRQSEIKEVLDRRQIRKEEINRLQELAQKVNWGLEFAEQDFETRRRLIETLNVKAVMYYEDGKERIRATCELGELNDPNVCTVSQNCGIVQSQRCHCRFNRLQSRR